MLKVIILIGGPQKGTRFRPLSLELPKPLFPVAGFPIIYHHIEACSKLPDIQEVMLIGTYQPSDALTRFVASAQREFKFNVRYLQEYTTLGTAGGLYHFRDRILFGQPKAFMVFNGDICCNFPLAELWDFHTKASDDVHFTMLSTEATREQSLSYGCLVENENTHEVMHYVEKPQTFVSSVINCGLYVFQPEIFQHIKKVFQENQGDNVSGDPLFPSKDLIRLEQDILAPLASTGKLFTYKTNNFWSQIKSAGSAIYANRLYLGLYHDTHPELLAKEGSETGPEIRGDVYIHPTANVDPTATLGPNVTVGANVTIGAGVRVRESIILDGASLQDHCCILHSIIGWNSLVGAWSRVEGTPNDPNPNVDHAMINSGRLFDEEGKLNPSITILGEHVSIPPEIIILNSIVLPHKELGYSVKNQILL